MKRHKESIKSISAVQGLLIVIFLVLVAFGIIKKQPHYFFIISTLVFIALISLVLLLKTALIRVASLTIELEKRNAIKDADLIEAEERFKMLKYDKGQTLEECPTCGAQVLKGETSCKSCGACLPKARTKTKSNKDENLPRY